MTTLKELQEGLSTKIKIDNAQDLVESIQTQYDDLQLKNEDAVRVFQAEKDAHLYNVKLRLIAAKDLKTEALAESGEEGPGVYYVGEGAAEAFAKLGEEGKDPYADEKPF